MLLVVVFHRLIHSTLLQAESPLSPPDALLLFVPRSSKWRQIVKIRRFEITLSFPGVFENYLVTFFFSTGDLSTT